jgi:hypothetical protein
MAAPVPQDGVAYPLQLGASFGGEEDATTYTLLRCACRACARACACLLPLHACRCCAARADARRGAVDFKPASIDASQAGALELGGARGAGAARASFAPCAPDRPPVAFEGAYVPTRDDCEAVLLFDGATVRLETLAGATCGVAGCAQPHERLRARNTRATGTCKSLRHVRAGAPGARRSGQCLALAGR